MCGVAFMFMGRSVEEVSPLTVMHANTMHHVMSTHLVTVCSDAAVNRRYPGNQAGGWSAPQMPSVPVERHMEIIQKLFKHKERDAEGH